MSSRIELSSYLNTYTPNSHSVETSSMSSTLTCPFCSAETPSEHNFCIFCDQQIKCLNSDCGKMKLIDQTLQRGNRPGIVLVDAGYGNNTNFLLELEKRQLKYLGGLAKNRKLTVTQESKTCLTMRLDGWVKSLPPSSF